MVVCWCWLWCSGGVDEGGVVVCARHVRVCDGGGCVVDGGLAVTLGELIRWHERERDRAERDEGRAVFDERDRAAWAADFHRAAVLLLVRLREAGDGA